MRENIYGPENRIVSAQMGMGYSMGIYLLASERVRWAALVHSSGGSPSVKNISSSYVEGPPINGYSSGTSYVTWGVYNSIGVLVATFSGSRWTKTVSVGGGGASFEFVEVNWPNTSNASWYVRNGSGIGSTSGWGSESDVPTTPISPSYYEQLALDMENNIGGTAQVLQVSDGTTVGRLYQEHWSNGLNGSLSRYYTHYAAYSPPLWSGYTGLVYHNVDQAEAYNNVRTVGVHQLAEQLPDDILTGICVHPHAGIYEVSVTSAAAPSLIAPANPLERGDGEAVKYTSYESVTHVWGPGLPLADWTYENGEISQQRAAKVYGSLVYSDSGKPSPLVAGANVAKLTFTNYYIEPASIYPVQRHDGRVGFISGTYVEGYENTLTFTTVEQHSVVAQAAGANVASFQTVYAFLREETRRGNAHVAAWATRAFKTMLASCMSPGYEVPYLWLKKIREYAKKSAGAYRDPELSVTVSDVQVYRILDPAYNRYSSQSKRTVTFEYTIEQGGETVVRTGTVVGTLTIGYEQAPSASSVREVHTYDNYYQSVSTWGGGLPFSDMAAVRAPDYACGANSSFYPHGINTGFITVSGRYVPNARPARGRAYTILDDADSNVNWWMNQHVAYGFFGTAEAENGLQVSVPPIVEQYLAEVPIKYRETTGTPKWVETAMYDGQTITLTWFGPKGKGPMAPWMDTDTEVEVYGQLVCRYDEKASKLRKVAWKQVKEPNHTFTVPNVRRIVKDSDGEEHEVVEEVVLPTRVAPRPIQLAWSYPYRYLENYAAVDKRNCIVTFSSIKWPDVKAKVRQEEEESKKLATLEKTILSLV